MSFFLDTQETSQRFGNEIVEFCSLLDANHIPHGSPDDLFGFAKILENNSQFRIDLSALVKSVVKKDTDKLLLTDMMSIIANSVGGPSVTETYVDITKPTTILMEFLLGTGCWRQFGSPSPQPVQNKTPSFKPSVRAESHAVEIPNSSSGSRANEKVENRASLLEVSSELRQTLSRLEFNTLQVKLHLDSIEQRISTIEDPPQASPPEIPSPAEPLLHLNNAASVANEVTQPHIEETPAYEVKLPTRGRAVFSHPYQDQLEDFSSPTFAYGTEKGRSIIPIGVFLALLAIVAACFFVYSGGHQRLLKDGILRLKTIRAHFSSSTHATTPIPPPAATLPSAPVPTSVPTSATPASSSPAIPTTSTKGAAEIIPRPSTASNDAAPIPANPKISYIPANVMEGRLLSAPRPEYPLFARTNHLEGQVTLQATISKTGSIKTLHAIKGPIPLRSAAIDAVYNWRYKPYLINGRPMDVITTVYVDFSLRPPPAMAH